MQQPASDNRRKQATGAQGLGIILLAAGLGWAFGWWWALVVLGAGFVLIGVAEELH